MYNSKYNCGDTVWACAFSYSSNKEGKKYYQKPVKGILVDYPYKNDEEYHNLKNKRKSYTDYRYFVPFKKNTNKPAWSKCVSIFSRMLADTEKECIKMYNDAVQKAIDWHSQEIENLKKEKV